MKQSILVVLCFYTLCGYSQQSQIDSLEKRLKTAKGKEKLDLYCSLGKLYSRIDVDKSNSYIVNVLQQARKDDSTHLRTSFFIKSNNYFYIGNFDSAIYFLDIASIYVKKNERCIALSEIKSAYGDCYSRLSKWDSSYVYLLDALKLCQVCRNDTGLAKVYNSMGTLFNLQDKLDSAIVYFKRSSQIKEKLKLYKDLNRSYNNLAASYRTIKNYNDALFYNKKAQAISRKNNDSIGLYTAITLFSEIQFDLKNHSLAEKSIMESIAFFKKKGITFRYIECLIILSDMYISQKKYDKAEKSLRDVIPLVKEMKNNIQLSYCYQTLADIKLNTKQYKEAYDYRVLQQQIEDTLFNEKMYENLQDVEKKYALETKNLQIDKQQQELRLKEELIINQKLSNSRKTIVIVTLLIISIMITGLFFVSRKYSAIKQQFNSLNAFINGQEEERKRISADLHDGICQELAGLKLDVGRLKLIEDDKEQEKLKNYKSNIDRAINEVREISHNLMPGVLIELGFIKSLENLAKKINQTHELKIDYTYSNHTNNTENISQTTGIHLYRIIQELINNTIKHAKASIVTLTVTLTENTLYISFKDNGIGINDTKINTGNGWKNMQSRITILEGKLLTKSIPNQGLEIDITVPTTKL